MITAESIKEFAENKSKACREAFQQLVSSEKAETRKALAEIAERKIAKYIKSADLLEVSNWKKLSEIMSIEELFLVIEAENKKESESSLLLQIAKVFRPVVNLMFQAALGIDLNSMPLEQQMEAGDGMFLAGMYLSYTERD